MIVTRNADRFLVIDEFLPASEFNQLISAFRTSEFHFENSQKWQKVWHPLDGRPLVGPGVTSRSNHQGFQSYPTKTDFDFFFKQLLGSNPSFGSFLGCGDQVLDFIASPYIYPAGSGLSWHSDAGPYRGAFVFYCHPTWRGHWGGELLLLDEPRLKVRANNTIDLGYWVGGFEEPTFVRDGVGTFVHPKPNRLVIIAPNTLHMTSPVSPKAGEAVRMSIAGFYI